MSLLYGKAVRIGVIGSATVSATAEAIEVSDPPL